MSSRWSDAVSVTARRGDPVLEIRGLCVDYGFGDDAVHAVSDCDLTLRRGEVMGLAGESGSGKSTLAMAAIRPCVAPAVITRPARCSFTPGRSAVARTTDHRPARCAGSRTARLALVGDRRRPAERVERVEPGARRSARSSMTCSRAHRRESHPRRGGIAAEDFSSIVGMNPDRLGSFPHELSGGMRQRVDDRDGTRARPAGPHPRRADDRAGRGHAARNPRRAHGPARPTRVLPRCSSPTISRCWWSLPTNHCDVRGPAHGARTGGVAVQLTPAAVHARAPQLLPADARGAPSDGGDPRFAARPPVRAAGMCIPPALRVGHGTVPPRSPRATAHRWIAARGCLLAARRDQRRAPGAGAPGSCVDQRRRAGAP